MTDHIVLKDGPDIYFVKTDIWTGPLTRVQAIKLLIDVGVSPGDADLDVSYYATVLRRDAVDIQYRPGRRKWIVDGRPSTKAFCVWSLREAGLSVLEAAQVLRIHQKCYEIEAKHV